MRILDILAAVTINGIGVPENQTVNIPNPSGNDIVNGVLNVVFFIMGAVAVIMIIISGYNYLTAGGDPGKVKKATSTIIYAIAGLAVSVSAYLIVNFVAGKL